MFTSSDFLTVYDCNLLNKNVVITDNCWGWLGATTRGGYPTMILHNSYGKVTTVSSVICEIYHGKCPSNLGSIPSVLHSCNNPSCISPHHVSWGTQRKNIRDAYKQGRMKNPAERSWSL